MLDKTISQYREEKGFTQEYMAGKLGVSIAAYCMYEKGKRNIPSDIAEKIAVILCIPKSAKKQIFLPATFAICKNEEVE